MNDPAPTFRRFLTGGPEQLRLSHASMTLLAGYAMAVIVLREAFGPGPGLGHVGAWQFRLLGAGGDVFVPLVTALVAARWLGSRLGVAAGVIQLTGLHVLGLPIDALWSDPWIGAMMAVAMAAFAWANVSGRLPPASGAGFPAAFYLSASLILMFRGWGEFASIPLACLAHLLLNQDGRAFRFLIHPIGLGVLAIFAGCTIWLHWPTTPQMVSFERCPFATAAVGMLPWSPLCAVAVVVGCWRGHYATAFWQFVVCWSLSPLLLATVGALSDRSALAMTSAPLSILAAAGLDEAVLWWRRPRYGRTARTTFRTGRPGR